MVEDTNNVQQEYVPVNRNDNTPDFKPYKPRYVSPVTVFLGAIGGMCLTVYALLRLLTEAVPIQSIVDLFKGYTGYELPLLIVGIVSLVLAIASEIRSRTKTPPAAWRVKNELIRSLQQYGLLDRDTSQWKGMFAVAPTGRYNRESMSFTLPFLLRHVNAQQFFDSIGDSLTGFARCQMAEVVSDNSRRLYNAKLILWYTDNPYGETTIEDMFEE